MISPFSRPAFSSGREDDPRPLQSLPGQLRMHPDSLSLLLRAARLDRGAANRISRVDQYEQKGGNDPLAPVIALEASPRDASRYLSMFIDQGGLSRQDLVQRVAGAIRGSRSLAATFQPALSGFSGTRDMDRDGDGLYEERWMFTSGVPTAWVRDENEDGVPEYSATFEKGVPASFTWKSDPKTDLTLKFNSYPSVESVEEKTASGAARQRSFLLEPFSVAVPFLGKGIPVPLGGLAPSIPAGFRLPGPGELLRASYRVEEYGADGTTVVRRIDLSHGKRVYMEEDTLGSGTLDHRVWYRDGQPVRGARDLNGSGKFDVEETWKNGTLSSIAVDTNGDGKVDYRERYGASPMKSWDYNEDGIVDSREYPAGRGTIVREFSTALNGEFDLSLVWEHDTIIRVTRRGRALALTPDSARGIVWIGPPAASGVPVNDGSAEGYTAIGGKEYLIFRHAGVTYAEELP